MTVAKRIAHSRKHLAVGNEYSYRSLMSSDLRSAMSTRATKAILSALKEDGYKVIVGCEGCPLPQDILNNTPMWFAQ